MIKANCSLTGLFLAVGYSTLFSAAVDVAEIDAKDLVVTDPKSPQEALQAFSLEPGLGI